MELVGVFQDREELEKAFADLQSEGIERAQLTILGTEDALRERLGVSVPRKDQAADASAPVDSDDEFNVARIVAGVPAYIGAVLAAGVTVASGGALGIAAIAAVAGGAGGGLLGYGAAKALHDQVEGSYADQLQRGGIMLLVHPRSPQDSANARAILERRAQRVIEHDPSTQKGPEATKT